MTQKINLLHFIPAEFGDWWQIMDVDLLRMLDEFREQLAAPVMISPAPGALGRRLGKGSTSRHNADRSGVVQAADVMLPRYPDLQTQHGARIVVDIAKNIGFGGIGYYPDWKPYPGLHLDSRPLKSNGEPATWGRIGQEYVTLDAAIDSIETTA